MDLQYLPPNKVVARAVQMHAASGHTLMLLIGQDASHATADIVAQLQDAGITFFGGIFPHIILGNQTRSDSCLVIDLPTIGIPYIIEAPFSPEKFDGLPTPSHLSPAGRQNDISALVFISGLTLDLTEFTRNLYRRYGVDIRYAGGGTGTTDLNPNIPSVFSSDGLFSNAAMIVFPGSEVSIGVQHGFRRRMGPYMATSTDDDRTVHEINWRPALEVYSEAILELTGEAITTENFRRFSARYPFAISNEADEDLIRKPVRLNGNSVVCGSTVLSHSLFFIMESDAESMSAAAAKATKTARIDAPYFSFVFECAARAGYLGAEAFTKELESIQAADTNESPPCFGVTSLGEIAANKRGLLECLNMTAVVAKVGRKAL